ncbi:major capsid protein, partial [Treponema endosymbiont of Eucomonympha sp.]|uniref:major capsid protein n=1 Tax=Treponema endosymbiont of Eucomonympha sp. TaxID=1580831 RepID=UPI001930F65B
YRDQNLDNEVPLDNSVVHLRRWEKDYFTSALPWPQRGVAPALPISGTGLAHFDDISATTISSANLTPFTLLTGSQSAGYWQDNSLSATARANALTNLKGILNTNTVTLDDVLTFDANDLRTVFQIQKWLERNARAGSRYVEFLGAHFGVHPRDDRLQRPEYIGGSRSPVIVSEVLQTSQSDTSPQGNMAGHGIAADRNY